MPSPFNQSLLLKVGDVAPDFALPAQGGATVVLSDVLQRAWAVLFFYGKNNTPLCSSQVCAFRNAYQDFRAAGAEVFGISRDSENAHYQMAERLYVPFHLLSDVDGRVAELYGVSKTFGVIPGRVTFVIDSASVVRMVYPSQFHAKAHMEKALKLLRQRVEEDASRNA